MVRSFLLLFAIASVDLSLFRIASGGQQGAPPTARASGPALAQQALARNSTELAATRRPAPARSIARARARNKNLKNFIKILKSLKILSFFKLFSLFFSLFLKFFIIFVIFS